MVKLLPAFLVGSVFAAACASTPQVDGPLIISLERNDAQDAGFGGVVAIEDDGCVTVEGFVVAWPPGTTWDDEAQVIVLPDGSRVGDGDSVTGSGGASDGAPLTFSLGEEALVAADRCTSVRVGEEPGVFVFNAESDSVSVAAQADGTRTTTSVPSESTRPVNFAEFERIGDGSSLTLILDACFPTLNNIEIEETEQDVVVAIVESFTPPTTNALGESEASSDCQSGLDIDLEQPLAGRKVVDASTGDMAEDLTE